MKRRSIHSRLGLPAWLLVGLSTAALSLVVSALLQAESARSVADAARERGPWATPEDQDPCWQDAAAEVHRGALNLLTQRQAELSQGLDRYRIYSGDGARREIALTFDDGPHPGSTPKLLSVLKQCHVKATFFLVGQMAARYPDLVRAEVAAGHCIGNHTYHHVNLTRRTTGTAATELQACGNVLRDITGRTPTLFRPPGGQRNSQVVMVARAVGCLTVLWNDFPADSNWPGKNVIKTKVLDEATPGGIVLLHDGVDQTLEVLPDICRQLQARGYKLVTVEELLKPTPAAASRQR